MRRRDRGGGGLQWISDGREVEALNAPQFQVAGERFGSRTRARARHSAKTRRPGVGGMLITERENMCDKRRGWKTHVPLHTRLPLTAKRQIKAGGGEGGGAAAKVEV